MRTAMIFLVALCGIALSAATICAPYSNFKIDCNTCFCSGDGTKYACTKKFCAEMGYPFTDDEQDFVLPRRKGKVQYPNDDEGFQNDVPKNVDWDDVKANEIDDDEGNVYDSAEDNSIDIDGEVPMGYRYKKTY